MKSIYGLKILKYKGIREGLDIIIGLPLISEGWVLMLKTLKIPQFVPKFYPSFSSGCFIFYKNIDGNIDHLLPIGVLRYFKTFTDYKH